MQIRIEGVDVPGGSCGPSPDRPDGYRGVHVAVQRRSKSDELLGLVAADAPSAVAAYLIGVPWAEIDSAEDSTGDVSVPK
jgi:hypothetical protein